MWSFLVSEGTRSINMSYFNHYDYILKQNNFTHFGCDIGIEVDTLNIMKQIVNGIDIVCYMKIIKKVLLQLYYL